MSAAKRRRWFSLSLRTVMTLISVGFGWFLYQRREKIAEKERLLKQPLQTRSQSAARRGLAANANGAMGE